MPIVQTRAHPRSRGEHPSPLHSAAHTPGSSPLARGTLDTHQRRHLRAGLIPARAGNTSGDPVCAHGSWAHPRSRGEHSDGPIAHVLREGSSPLARGTLRGLTVEDGARGLIPARAGNTTRGEGPNPHPGAHPRSRGEHVRVPYASPVVRGSSPLARGTLDCPPLCAPPLVGSSPLARGTQSARKYDCRYGGLIPARAGNTLLLTLSATPKRAHPRSRGEHRLFRPIREAPRGSSPLARGTLAEDTERPPPWVGSSPLARGTHLLTWDFTPYISKIESLWSQSLTPEYTISSHY